MIDDTDIINAVRRDPENGFRILMKAKWEPVYWHIRRLVIHHADAQDATQETFIRLFRSFDKFKGESSLKVWIYRIATNEALRLIGKRHNDIISIDDDNVLEVRMVADEEYVNYADVEAVKLQNAILSLPPKQQLDKAYKLEKQLLNRMGKNKSKFSAFQGVRRMMTLLLKLIKSRMSNLKLEKLCSME